MPNQPLDMKRNSHMEKGQNPSSDTQTQKESLAREPSKYHFDINCYSVAGSLSFKQKR